MARRCQSGTQNRSLLHKVGHCRKECKGWIPNKVANFSEKEDFSPRYRISLYIKKNEKSPFLSIGLQSDRSANILEWEWAVDIKATYGGVATLGRED